jgi:hypothetical protein
MQTWYYIFVTALLDSGHVPQKNFPFNNFREPHRQHMLKHSVESRMLSFIAIALKNHAQLSIGRPSPNRD